MKFEPPRTPVPDDASLLRLPRPPPDMVPDDFRPSAKHFEPSKDERADGLLGWPVRVSVWDETRTSIDEARAFRDSDVVVLRLGARAVRDVGGARGMRVEVVDDLLPARDRDRPGAAGHAGVEGLDRPTGGERAAWQALRQDLADACDVVR